MSILKALCRLCLGTIPNPNETSLFDNSSGVNLNGLVFICTSIDLQNDADLPEYVCKKCCVQLHKTFQFREQCINTEKLLLQYLQCKNKSSIMNVLFPVKDSINNYEALSKLIAKVNSSYELERKAANAQKAKNKNMDVSNKRQCTKPCASEQKEVVAIEDKNDGNISETNEVENEDNFNSECSSENDKRKPQRRRKCKPTLFICKYCQKSYPSEGGWRYHVHTVHNLSYQPFICDICGKAFKTKKNMEGHKSSVHFGIKQNLCDLCGRGFATKYALSVHKTWHSGEKNFPCEICGMRFNTLAKVNTHRTIHGGPKKFMCEVCSRKFRWKKDFEIHSRTHTGEKPFICRHCSKAFSSLTNAKKHESGHKMFRSEGSLGEEKPNVSIFPATEDEVSLNINLLPV